MMLYRNSSSTVSPSYDPRQHQHASSVMEVPTAPTPVNITVEQQHHEKPKISYHYPRPMSAEHKPYVLNMSNSMHDTQQIGSVVLNPSATLPPPPPPAPSTSSQPSLSEEGSGQSMFGGGSAEKRRDTSSTNYKTTASNIEKNRVIELNLIGASYLKVLMPKGKKVNLEAISLVREKLESDENIQQSLVSSFGKQIVPLVIRGLNALTTLLLQEHRGKTRKGCFVEALGMVVELRPQKGISMFNSNNEVIIRVLYNASSNVFETSYFCKASKKKRLRKQQRTAVSAGTFA